MLVELCIWNKYNILNKDNMGKYKNPNWQEADQLAIHKHDRGVELGTTDNKSR